MCYTVCTIGVHVDCVMLYSYNFNYLIVMNVNVSNITCNILKSIKTSSG
jgi:hypothetical protein